MATAMLGFPLLGQLVLSLTLHDLVLFADNAGAHLLVYYVHAPHAEGSPGAHQRQWRKAQGQKETKKGYK